MDHLRLLPMDDSMFKIKAGLEEILCYDGTSQYSSGGPSACGLASMNFVRTASEIAMRKVAGDVLLAELIQKKTIEKVMGICSLWKSGSHLDVEDIAACPVFSNQLHRLPEIVWHTPSLQSFADTLSKLRSFSLREGTVCAIVITRPPEILTCLCVPSLFLGQKEKTTFVLFDSHPRPSYPEGSGIVINSSERAISARLNDIFYVDPSLFNDPSLQWQAGLLTHYSGHFFIPNLTQPMRAFYPHEEKIILSSSIQLLATKMELEELKERNVFLERRHDTIEDECIDLKAENTRLTKILTTYKQRNPTQGPGPSYSRPPERINFPNNTLPSTSHDIKPIQGTQSFYSPPQERNNFTDSTLPSTSRDVRQGTQSSYSHPQERTNLPSNTLPSTSRDIKPTQGTQSFISFPPERNNFPSGTLPPPSISRDVKGKGREIPLHHQILNSSSSSSAPYSSLDSADDQGVIAALALQSQFDLEDRELVSQRNSLLETAISSFHCPLCLEELPEDDIASIDDSGCKHTTCRSCLTGYVTLKIRDRVYPIVCPVCVAERGDRQSNMGNDVLGLLGISSQDVESYQEMELAAFSVLLHCRRCKQTIWVDRTEYNEAVILTCPLPNCTFAWCKNCSFPIKPSAPTKHTCDGSEEMGHLIKQRGWKTCPGCQTIIQKIDGCNHMTCMAPGCNTHFCYTCGSLIVKSTLRRDIRRKVSDHYTRCTLFEDVGGE